MTRPEIHSSKDGRFVSISTSTEDYAIRSLNAYACYSNDTENVYYIIPNDAKKLLQPFNFNISTVKPS